MAGASAIASASRAMVKQNTTGRLARMKTEKTVGEMKAKVNTTRPAVWLRLNSTLRAVISIENL